MSEPLSRLSDQLGAAAGAQLTAAVSEALTDAGHAIADVVQRDSGASASVHLETRKVTVNVEAPAPKGRPVTQVYVTQGRIVAARRQGAAQDQAQLPDLTPALNAGAEEAVQQLGKAAVSLIATGRTG